MMPRILVTAFEAYDRWTDNASWLCLMELTRDLPGLGQITTRRYPVVFSEVRQRLLGDLESNYDVVLHLGQAPGESRVTLEAVGLNVAGEGDGQCERFGPLEPDGPLAYRSPLPLDEWSAQLRTAGIPAQVSHHAGTYLCNAALYWSCHFAARLGLPTRAALVHLPLATSQVVEGRLPQPHLPTSTAAAAVRLLLEQVGQGADGTRAVGRGV